MVIIDSEDWREYWVHECGGVGGDYGAVYVPSLFETPCPHCAKKDRNWKPLIGRCKGTFFRKWEWKETYAESNYKMRY